MESTYQEYRNSQKAANAEWIKEIKKSIRETRKEMKEMGVRRISCLNGGLTPMEYQYNSRLFQLSVDLEKSERERDRFASA